MVNLKQSLPTSALSLLAVAAGCLGTQASAHAATLLNVTPTNDANTLANTIVGSGVTISKPTYTGASVASGTFTGGNAAGLGIDSGIMLTTGKATDASNPSSAFTNGTAGDTNNGKLGDTDLNGLTGGYSTYDAAALQFNFNVAPGSNSLFFKYAFASEEYQSYANTSYNDAFGFFLDGKNVALLPGTTTPVSINTVNGGNPLPTSSNAKNSQYFVNNRTDTGTTASQNIVYQGFTKPLTVDVSGLSAGTHTIKLAVADTSDSALDSAVFIQAGTFSNAPPPVTTPIVTPLTTPSAEAVPEPSSILSTLGFGVLGAGYMLKRSKQKPAKPNTGIA